MHCPDHWDRPLGRRRRRRQPARIKPLKSRSPSISVSIRAAIIRAGAIIRGAVIRVWAVIIGAARSLASRDPADEGAHGAHEGGRAVVAAVIIAVVAVV